MCKAIREGDEMACSCGLRWDIDEPDPHDSISRWRVMPYMIVGVNMYAVEDQHYYTKMYCDTREDAQKYCDEFNAVMS